MSTDAQAPGDGMSEDTAHILSHLSELRRRIIYSLVSLIVLAAVAFAFYEPLIELLKRPFDHVALSGEVSSRLVVHTVTEGFLVRLRVAALGGVILALPIIGYNVLRFIFPGLYPRERKAVATALAASAALAIGGFVYSYMQLLPISLRFLTESGFIPDDVGVILSYRESLGFVLQILLITVLLFQLPVVVLLLLKLNVLERATALKAGPYVLVALFTLSAVLTPPDIISQVGLAIPLGGLYFLAILVARIFRLGEG